ncbi:MAG: DUF5312 family protein [Spirochaetota bacterium]
MATATLRQLVRSLTDDERKKLHDRILKSLALTSVNQPRIFKTEISVEQRNTMLRQDLDQLGLLLRFRLWFRQILTGKTIEGAYVDYRLSKIRRRIQATGIDEEAPEPETVSEGIALQFYRLYRECYPLIPLFHFLWDENERLSRVARHLLEQRVPEPRSRPEDFASTRELQDAFLDRDDRSAPKELLLDRIEEYLGEIHDDLFRHVEGAFLPLYYLRDICLFPYRAFFRPFGVRIGDEPPQEDTEPTFKPAAASAVVEKLELMYYALYASSRLGKGDRVPKDLLESIHLSAGDDEVVPLETDQLQGYFDRLIAAVSRFRRAVPVGDLIRYIRQDPYYRFVAYLPSLNIRGFYADSLHISVLSQLDERLEDIRMGAIGRLIQDVFPADPPPFQHYGTMSVGNLRELGLPAIRYVKSLNILYNFIRIIFTDSDQEFIRHVARLFPTRRREAANDLLLHTNGLVDIGERIRALDRTFAPDLENGKTLFRLRHGAEKDSSLHPTYRNFVAGVDRQAKTLLEDGLSDLQHVEDLLREIPEAASPSVKERLNAHSSLAGGTIDETIAAKAKRISTARRAIMHLLTIEEGG